jgi:hypothetical protein
MTTHSLAIGTPERYRQLAESIHRLSEMAQAPEVKRSLARAYLVHADHPPTPSR